MARLTENSSRPFGLLLCNYKDNQGAVVVDSINSFLDYSSFPFMILPMHEGFDEHYDFEFFDFIVIHYSVIPTLPGFISGGISEKLRKFRGLKIQMVQDDYRMIDILVEFMKFVEINVVYTVTPPEVSQALYKDRVGSIEVETYLTGYVSHWLRLERPTPILDRRVDVGYRGRRYPHWLGDAVSEKTDLVKQVDRLFRRAGLRTNISIHEADRLYGRDWVKFLKSCRAVFGVETDANFLDPFGYVHSWYDSQEKLHRPKRWNGKVVMRDDFFLKHARPVPGGTMAVLPPRVFEVIALRSANVLLEGHYSGVLIPWRHYIPLKKDLSNTAEIIDAVRNPKLLIDVISVAFAEIANNRAFTYQGFSDQIDATIRNKLGAKHVRINISHPDDIQGLSSAARFYKIQNPHVLHVDNPARRASRLKILLHKGMSRVRALRLWPAGS